MSAGAGSVRSPRSPGFDRRILPALLAGLGLLGVAIGGQLVPWLIPVSDESLPPFLFPARPNPGLAEEPGTWLDLMAPAASRSLRHASGAARPALTAGAFLALVSRELPGALGREFTRAFMDSQPLRELWWKAQAEGPDAPAAPLLMALHGSVEFRALLGRFKGAPGFREGYLRVAGHPEVKAALSQAARSTPGPLVAAGGAPRSAGDAAPGPSRLAAEKEAATGGGSPSRELGRASAGGLEPARSPAAASSSFGAVRASPPDDGAKGSDSARDAAAHDAVRLARLREAGAQRDLVPFVPSALDTIRLPVRLDMLLVCQKIDEACEPLIACARSELAWKDCQRACAADRKRCPDELEDDLLGGIDE